MIVKPAGHEWDAGEALDAMPVLSSAADMFFIRCLDSVYSLWCRSVGALLSHLNSTGASSQIYRQRHQGIVRVLL